MPRKEVISLSEFKMVVEEFKNEIKKVVEVMNFRFDKNELDIQSLKEQIAVLHEGQTMIKYDVKELKTDVKMLKTDVSMLKTDVSMLKTDVSMLKTDVSMLKEQNEKLFQGQEKLFQGQNEIRAELSSQLSNKVTRNEFSQLEKRVVIIENKVA